MANNKIFDTRFEVVKARGGGGAGRDTTYRKGIERAHVIATSVGGVKGVLEANLTLASGESVEIINITEETRSTNVIG